MTLKLDMQHKALGLYRVCSNDDLWLVLTYLQQDQIWSLGLVYGKKGKLDFSEAM